MTLLPVKDVAQILGVTTNTLTARIVAGHLHRKRLRQPDNNRPCWHIDLDDALAHFAEHPARTSRGSWKPAPRVPAAEPIPLDDLTYVQCSVLASETWHDLLNLQPAGRGAVRAWWSNGETYILRPNGEQDGYAYTEAG